MHLVVYKQLKNILLNMKNINAIFLLIYIICVLVIFAINRYGDPHTPSSFAKQMLIIQPIVLGAYLIIVLFKRKK